MILILFKKQWWTLKKLSFSFIYLWLVALITPLYSSAEVQYEPFASPERHELSFSLFSYKPFSKKIVISPYSFAYALYITELDQFLPEKTRKIFALGLSAGLSFFKSKADGGTERICHSDSSSSLAWRTGLKAKIRYFFLQPFAEFGFADSDCRQKGVEKRFESQFSFGFSLSLKVLDPSAIYSLDQDYGINDVGLLTECLNYQVSGPDLDLFCQIGLQVSF